MSATETAGMLSLVGTPIGNLQDASPRVLETLRRADVLLCEDTRVTAKLLARFDIRVSLLRCDENVIASRVDDVLRRLEAGERVAFVSDAGMPGVSDPGQKLVDAALNAGMPVEVIPGPSAVTCALVASGLPMDHFFFEGFLPRKDGARVRRLTQLAGVPGALVFYESPHRVVATVRVLAQVFPQRRVALVRELTKVHEEVRRALAPELAEQLAAGPEVRGECVLVVEGPREDEEVPQARSFEDALSEGLAQGMPKSQLAKQLAKEFRLSRSEAYDRILGQSGNH